MLEDFATGDSPRPFSRFHELRHIATAHGLSLAERAVLRCLVDGLDNGQPANRQARRYYSYARLAQLTGLCRRTVGTAHRRLRTLGILVDVRQRAPWERMAGTLEVGFDLSRIPAAKAPPGTDCLPPRQGLPTG